MTLTRTAQTANMYVNTAMQRKKKPVLHKSGFSQGLGSSSTLTSSRIEPGRGHSLGIVASGRIGGADGIKGLEGSALREPKATYRGHRSDLYCHPPWEARVAPTECKEYRARECVTQHPISQGAYNLKDSSEEDEDGSVGAVSVDAFGRILVRQPLEWVPTGVRRHCRQHLSSPWRLWRSEFQPARIQSSPAESDCRPSDEVDRRLAFQG